MLECISFNNICTYLGIFDRSLINRNNLTNQMGSIKTNPAGLPAFFLPQATLEWLCLAALVFFTLLHLGASSQANKCCNVGLAEELLTLGYWPVLHF